MLLAANRSLLLPERANSYNSSAPLELFNREVGISIDANFAGDSHGFHREVLSLEAWRAWRARARRLARRCRRSRWRDAVVRLDHVAITRKHECAFEIGDDKKSFEVAERAIFAPFFRQFHGGLLQISGMFLELAFEALEERNASAVEPAKPTMTLSL